MKRFRLFKRLKNRRRKRKNKPPKRKQRGGLFGFEYLMHSLANRKQNPNNSLYKALESFVG